MLQGYWQVLQSVW